MKSLDNVIDAILAHLRSWPAFYADPARGITKDRTSGGRTGGGTPAIPPVAGAAAPMSRTPIGRGCYRVEPTEWGMTASQPSSPATSCRPSPVSARRSSASPARRRSSSLLGAHRLPTPRGLLTCSPESSDRSR